MNAVIYVPFAAKPGAGDRLRIEFSALDGLLARVSLGLSALGGDAPSPEYQDLARHLCGEVVELRNQFAEIARKAGAE
jgi:hypothetical protein